MPRWRATRTADAVANPAEVESELRLLAASFRRSNIPPVADPFDSFRRPIGYSYICEATGTGNLLDTARILRDGGLLSVGASTYLLLLLRFNPRMFLKHFPQEIRDIVPPKSAKERRMSILLGAPLGLLFLGSTIVSAILWRGSRQGSHSFLELFAHVFCLFFFFNLVDLLILDWLIVCRFTPGWLVIPGTEHVVMPKEYLYHVQGFLIGTVVSVIGGLAVAAVLHFVF